jgi:hypothetical protein
VSLERLEADANGNLLKKLAASARLHLQVGVIARHCALPVASEASEGLGGAGDRESLW